MTTTEPTVSELVAEAESWPEVKIGLLQDRVEAAEKVLRWIIAMDAPDGTTFEVSDIIYEARKCFDLPQNYELPSGTHIDDLFPRENLEAEISAGHVRAQTHPQWPYTIYNYTEKAQFDGAWNKVTRICRGLIVDEFGWVLARPMKKFFNYGEPHADALELNLPAVVTDKLDGSLGICYPTPDGLAIATRGSFTSDQALHATKVLRERYADFKPAPGYTYLFEIIYPGNRIVVDYSDTDDLFLLGKVRINSGRITPPNIDSRWPGPKTTTFRARTLAEALAMPPRPNAEGLVVWQPVTGAMVKIKQEDYLAAHRILTRMSPRVIWEFLAVNACKDLIEKPKHWGSRLGINPERARSIVEIGPEWRTHLIEGIPDEFHQWLNDTADDLLNKVANLYGELLEIASTLELKCDSRREIAEKLKGHPHAGAIFQLIDGKDIKTYCWKHVYPEASKPWGERGEDVA